MTKQRINTTFNWIDPLS